MRSTDACIIDAGYVEEGGKVFIKLWCKDKRGETVILLDEYEPYFYALPYGDVDVAKEEIARSAERGGISINRIETAKRKVFGDERTLLKIFCYRPADVPKVRDAIKALERRRGGSVLEDEYEYGINFHRRYMLDKSLSGMQWLSARGEETETNGYAAFRVSEMKLVEDAAPALSTMAFDIESFEEAGKQKVIMISLVGGGLEKVLCVGDCDHPAAETFSSEAEMLRRFVQLVRERDPDVLVGYNSDEFDFAVIRDRARENGVALLLSRDGSEMAFEKRGRVNSAYVAGRVHLDLFRFVSNVLASQLQTETLGLDAVAAELLGDRKIEMELEDILEAWRKQRDLGELAEYCLKDAELALRLAGVLLPQVQEISRITGQTMFDASRMTYGQLVEWYLARNAVAAGEIIPNQPKFEEMEKRRAMPRYTGGFVKEPVGGIHENVAVLDFRSLYPSIISTFNISPETLNCSCCIDGHEVPGTKYHFCKKRKGFVSGVIGELISRRAEIKKPLKMQKHGSAGWRELDSRQHALKIIANATYGMFAFAGARWYCRECAEAAAAFGRFYIGRTIEEARPAGFTVIYADTDSVFLNLPEGGDVGKRAVAFLERMNASLPGSLELELQGIYKRGIFMPRGAAPGTAKKRYALIDEKGALTIRGLERVRKDWSNVARETQEAVLRLVLRDMDVEGAVGYVRKVVRMLRDKKVPLRELTIYEQLAKPLGEYRLVGPHVAAARKIKERGRPVGAGMLVMYAVTKGKQKESISSRAEPIEDVTIDNVDEEYYINNQVVPAALRVLRVLGVTGEQLLGDDAKEIRSFLGSGGDERQSKGRRKG